MTTILDIEVYKRVLERNEDEIRIRKSSGFDSLRYTFDKFLLDVKYRGLIKTTKTAKERWLTLISNEVLMVTEGREPYSWGFLYIPNLEALAAGRQPRESRERVCVCAHHYIPEDGAAEGSE